MKPTAGIVSIETLEKQIDALLSQIGMMHEHINSLASERGRLLLILVAIISDMEGMSVNIKEEKLQSVDVGWEIKLQPGIIDGTLSISVKPPKGN